MGPTWGPPGDDRTQVGSTWAHEPSHQGRYWDNPMALKCETPVIFQRPAGGSGDATSPELIFVLENHPVMLHCIVMLTCLCFWSDGEQIEIKWYIKFKTHWGRHKMTAFRRRQIQMYFLERRHEFRLIFCWILFQMVRVTTLQHWFR